MTCMRRRSTAATCPPGQLWVLRWLLMDLLCPLCRGLYDPARKLESARLYGNIDAYAYYFVDLIVGTPPQRVSVILDTGSGVTAFPCKGCGHCGKHIDPLFDISRSSSAHWIKCGQCPGVCKSGKCNYRQGYTEGSSITGSYFTDMVRLGDAIQRNPPVLTTLGCHTNENNLFFTQKANGIMGIRPPAKGQTTLLQRLFEDQSHVDGHVFSICLAEWGGLFTVGGYNESTHLGKLSYVPLQPGSSYYRVPLTSMRINGKTITNFRSTMIDSGTTYTYMSTGCYKSLLDGLSSYCTSNSGGTGKSCGATRRGNCWQLPNSDEALDVFPTIDVVFDDVTTKWIPRAYLYRKGSGNQWCVSFMNDGPNANTVLGASWMLHKSVVFDMRKRRVGVASATCPEHRERPQHDVSHLSVPVAAQTVTAKTTTWPDTGGDGSNFTTRSSFRMEPPGLGRSDEDWEESTHTGAAAQALVDARSDRIFKALGPARWAGPAVVTIAMLLTCIAMVQRRCFGVEAKAGAQTTTRNPPKTVIGSADRGDPEEEDHLVATVRRAPIPDEDDERPQIISSSTAFN